jgi:pimeloyl-ACP methyl ester carboxylesterase
MIGAAAGLMFVVALLAGPPPVRPVPGGPAAAGPAAGGSVDAVFPRYLIYLHGRIVQEQQSTRPKSAEYGYYELDKILQAFRDRGFMVTGDMRPRAATVDESADQVVTQVRKLLAAHVPADHVTVVGASMGASIALLASTRLQNPDVRFGVLGECLSGNVRSLVDEHGIGPSGHLLSIREASDELSNPCPAWKDDPKLPNLTAREIVLNTGLRHGFLYRPLPEWLDPVVDWTNQKE